MSKFGYKSAGELNSQYLLDLINEYFSLMLVANDINGEDKSGRDIDIKASYLSQNVKDWFNRLHLKNGPIPKLEDYDKKVSTLYINSILQKLQIFLQTDVLTPKEIFDIKQMLKTIGFKKVVPIIEESRIDAITKSEKMFLKCLKEVNKLKYANSEYILFNSPVLELKPFLSDKVSIHKVNVEAIQVLISQFVDMRNCELNDFAKFKEVEIELPHNAIDFYKDKVIESGVGEDIESYIRNKMLDKLEIDNKDDVLDTQKEKATIDAELKRVGLYKIEQLMENLAVIKCEQANAKEILGKCKEMLNKSTLANKEQIFLTMDKLYYKLTNKCEKLEGKIKNKLQAIDKQKVFNLIDKVKDEVNNSKKQHKNNKIELENLEKNNLQENLNDDSLDVNQQSNANNKTIQASKDNLTHDNKASRAYNDGLYDDDDDDGEIDIVEDDTSEDMPENEIVIEDKDDKDNKE